VTTNVRDFVELLDVDVHPGLIVLRESGLSRTEQWDRLKPAIEHVQESGDPDFLLNKLIEITRVGQFEVRKIRSHKVQRKPVALTKILPRWWFAGVVQARESDLCANTDWAFSRYRPKLGSFCIFFLRLRRLRKQIEIFMNEFLLAVASR